MVICPALSSARGVITDCQGNTCAWFIGRMGVCAVAAIAINGAANQVFNNVRFAEEVPRVKTDV